jgi:hypothetical protein
MYGVRLEMLKDRSKTARIQTENAYSLTVNGALTVVRYLLEQK